MELKDIRTGTFYRTDKGTVVTVTRIRLGMVRIRTPDGISSEWEVSPDEIMEEA